MKIEPFDPVSAPDAELAAHHDLVASIDVEAVPDDEPQPLADFAAWMRIAPAARRTWCWAAWDEDRKRMRGLSFFMYWDEEANRTLGSFWVYIRPEARRQRLGLRLLEPLAEVARSEGRTLLDAAARPGIAASAAFLESLGGRHAFTGHLNALDVGGVDLGTVNGWVDRAKERAADYRLEGWDGRCPDDHIDAFVAAQGIMNTAPRENFEAEDDAFTVDLHRQREAANAQRGADYWVLEAIHGPSGAIAGYTEIVLPSTWPTRGYQGDTGVDPAHRNKGLGRWLKAAMLLRLLDERPGVRRVTTQNAGSNAPMLNINHALGFRCIEEHVVYQVPLDVLTDRIARG